MLREPSPSRESLLGPYERLAIKGKANVVKWEQDHLAALYSLVVCDMSRSAISNDTYLALLSAATGWNFDYPKFLEIGERIWNVTRIFNVREGIGRKDDTMLPKRFKEPLSSGPAKGHRFKDNEFGKMLDDYYSERGWDKDGKPTKDKLHTLDIH
jgi:aldehyde:ferredoxin oxidoreductase